jgi:hypothetical protein
VFPGGTGFLAQLFFRFLRRMTAPYFLCACFSHAARFPLGFFLHALIALASFWALVRDLFEHPETLTGVFCVNRAPFWAPISVGITSFDVHRFPFVARAEKLPCGSVNSKVLNGTSGSV